MPILTPCMLPADFKRPPHRKSDHNTRHPTEKQGERMGTIEGACRLPSHRPLILTLTPFRQFGPQRSALSAEKHVAPGQAPWKRLRNVDVARHGAHEPAVLLYSCELNIQKTQTRTHTVRTSCEKKTRPNSTRSPCLTCAPRCSW